MEFSNPPRPASAEPRRVSTASTCSNGQQQPAAAAEPGDGSVDTLYDHPSVKIVAFTAGPRTFSIGPRSGVSPLDCQPGTLAWSSQLERTIAVGKALEPARFCPSPLTHASRPVPHIPRSRIGRLPQLRIRAAAYLAKESGVVCGRRVEQVRAADSTTSVLAD